MGGFVEGVRGLAVLVVIAVVVGTFLLLVLWLAKPFLDAEDRKYFEARRRLQEEDREGDRFDAVAECEAILWRVNPDLAQEYEKGKRRRRQWYADEFEGEE